MGLTYGSVCSGIEAATVAWQGLGWRPAWFAEIDPFASAVLAHHYPKVRNYGDFTKITGKQAYNIDLLVGGTPCQAFSVAGKRQGLDDPRGNLTLEFLSLVDRAIPKWVVWENVPGVLSIDGGRTFGAIQGILAECGYGFAWRVLDAQYFGVPQRRRRIFIVGHFGDWRPAAAVLFERESLCRDTPARRKAREEVAVLTADGVETCVEVAPPLLARGGRFPGTCADTCESLIAHTLRSVRRLTPRECERLQGFPDDYTLIPNYRRKIKAHEVEEIAAYLGIPVEEARELGATPDGPRYKVIGNSMAVPVMRWIGERIDKVERILS